MITILYNILYNAFYVFIGWIFFNAFYPAKVDAVFNRLFRIIMWFMSVNVISFTLNSNIILKLLLAVIINAVFVFFHYQQHNNKIIISLLLGALFQGLAVGSDLVLIAIQKNFSFITYYFELFEESVSGLFMAISLLVQFIISLVLNKVVHKKDITAVTKEKWLSFMIFPCYSLLLIIALLFAFDGEISSFQAKLFLWISLSILLLNIIVFLIINAEINRQTAFQKQILDIAHAKEIINLYETLSMERKELGKREHEYNNTLIALTKLYDSGNIKHLGELLHTQINAFDDSNVFETGNPIMSTLFNIKYSEIKQKDIRFQFTINDLSGLIIDNQDAIILVSNLFNNAIEASFKCPISERQIKMKAILENKQFILSMANSKNNTVIKDSNGNFISSKKDSISHGYGINRIIEIVNQYNGIYDINISDKEFTFTIVIPQ